MKTSTLLVFVVALLLSGCQTAEQNAANQTAGQSEVTHPMVFASFANTAESFAHTLILAESIRTFGGGFKDAPIWIFVPENRAFDLLPYTAQISGLQVEVKTSTAPEDSQDFYYSDKVFASAQAETEAAGQSAILVWMDEDTVILTEPSIFALPEGVSLGYRPVMHQLIGSLYSLPPDEFWTRVYNMLEVPNEAVFPMTTIADDKTIRAYFNAGLLVVRPERGLLRKWANEYPILYRDSLFQHWAEDNQYVRIFLHQVALAGSTLNLIRENETLLFPETVNWPLFFKRQFGAVREFDNVEGVVTLRYDAYFRNPEPDWAEQLSGPPDKIAWMKARLKKG